MTCQKHGGGSGSTLCRECDLELIENAAKKMSDTPRTDFVLKASDTISGIKDVTPFAVQELCRQLERELAAAKAAERERCKKACQKVLHEFMRLRDKYESKDTSQMYEYKAGAALDCVHAINALKDK